LGLDELLVMVVQQGCQAWAEAGQPPLRVQHSSTAVLSQHNQTLVFYPFFKDMQRPCHLTSYNNDDLGILSGSGQTYQYATIDRHLRELTHLRLSGPLGCALARRYWQQWYQSGEWAHQHVFYLDAHEKVLWTSKPGPVGFVSACHEVRACLKQFYIHGRGQHVLYCETQPCDVHLSERLLAIIADFEAAIGHSAVHVIVVDREGLSVDVIMSLQTAQKAIVTMLRANQYTGESDFKRRSAFLKLKDHRTDEVTHRVADADFRLTDELTIRCGLVYPSDQPGRLIVVVTTVSRQQVPDIRTPVTWYLDRWEVQENSFRALEAFIQIHLNFGLNAKRQVPDRRVAGQIAELTQHLRAVEHKIERKQAQQTEEQRLIDDLIARYDQNLASVYRRLANPRRRVGQDGQRQAELDDCRQRYHARLAKHLAQQHQLEAAIEQHQAERTRVLAQLADLDPQAMFFEVDAEKDQIMTHLRIAAYNSALLAREKYFGPAYRHARPLTLWRLFFSQDGYYRESDDCLLITLKPFRDPQLHQAAREACQRFNAHEIQLRSGKRLKMTVGECK